MSYHFDQAAISWDKDQNRIALASAVGEAILREAQPTKETTVFDYGCGTGLVSLFLRPYVASVVAADNSPAMLAVLAEKIRAATLTNIRTAILNLEEDPCPSAQYQLIVSSMTMHHVAAVDKVLTAFHSMLHPGGILCLADLDPDHGLFHPSEIAESVRHNGFDREELKATLYPIGFKEPKAVTAHSIRKAGADGVERSFTVFLMSAFR